MNLHFTYPSLKKHEGELAEHTVIALHEPGHDTIEGSEFLDDAIRMNDQPFMYNEKNNGVTNDDDLFDYSRE